MGELFARRFLLHQWTAPVRQPPAVVAFPSPGGLRPRSASLKTGSQTLEKARFLP